jgi:tetratricopeptide (TPR) repeat protein
MAFRHLSQQHWDQFIGYASKYLFTERTAKKSTLMMKYYIAIVLCHIKQDATQSLKHILECLAVKPLMAEFWCLLGDVYYHRLGNYEKAQQFYQNAITLGSRRPKHDKSPIEIQKYRQYPEKMIVSCQSLKRETHTVVKMPIAQRIP